METIEIRIFKFLMQESCLTITLNAWTVVTNFKNYCQLAMRSKNA